MTDLTLPVSGRMFAKMTGQSEGAVRKAVARNSIIKGRTPDGKFIPEIASKEWGKAILKEYLNSAPEPVIKKQPVVKKTPVKKSAPVKKREPKKEAETYDEVVKEIMKSPLPKVSDEDLENEPITELSDHDDKVEAERRSAIIKTRILQIELEKKRGTLVEIDKVNSVLFSYGQEIRVAIEGISNKCIDRILATNSRHEAKRVLDTEIYDTLNLLSDIQNRKFE